jgi:hypothetical protein
MPSLRLRPLEGPADPGRRRFVRALGAASAAAGGCALLPRGLAEGTKPRPSRPETNLDSFMAVPRGPFAIPGSHPGKVVEIWNPRCLAGDRVNGRVVAAMFREGLGQLTGTNERKAFERWFSKDDVVGIKINPVGPPLIAVHLEVVDAIVGWLTRHGLPRERIVIWDRFDYMLHGAGYTAERYPGTRVVGLQTMGLGEDPWRDESGNHVSAGAWDKDAFYFAKDVLGKNVKGYESDEFYLNQHVFNGEYSYFAKLITQDVTKIINVASFKNTGNGVSMATKNLGYAVICNTGRLHHPLSLHVNTEVLAAPWVRDKLVLNVIDGIRGQYDGGPMMNEQFVFDHHTLYLATDPFALDTIGHEKIVAKRKKEGVNVNEHPRFTEYLRQGQQLGLGVSDRSKIDHVRLRHG